MSARRMPLAAVSLALRAATAAVLCAPVQALGYNSPTSIAVESSGDLVVVDEGLFTDNVVYRVDPASGDRAVVSGVGVGAGVDLEDPSAVVVESDGSLVVSAGFAELLRIDPVTGDRILLHGSSSFEALTGLAVDATGDLIWTDSNRDAVVRETTIVSDATTGAGPIFSTPSDVAVEASGDFVVADIHLGAVLRVDPVTGDREIVSDGSTGAGPAFDSPKAIAVEASGDLLVVDSFLDAVFRIDPVTGDRTIVSDAGTGAGVPFERPADIAVDASGDLLVVDTDRAAVFRVDPVTGERLRIGDRCAPTPNLACTMGFAKAQLTVVEKKVGREKLVAKLRSGPEIMSSELGDPTAFGGTSVSVCLYDDADALVATLLVDRAGEWCLFSRCWDDRGPPTGKGYVYKDRLARSDGVRNMTLRAGPAGKSTVLIVARNGGASVHGNMPTGIAAALSSTTSVRMEVSTDEGVCFGATLTDIRKQDATIFKAR